MGQVIISGVTFEIYGDETGANAYHSARLGASLWSTSDALLRRQALVSATRWIDRQTWQGQKTSSVQPLAFPRTGLVDCDGNAVSSVTVPQQIIDATYELALILLGDPAAAESASSGSNFRRVKAGSAEVEYFKSTFGSASRFPPIVHEVVRCFLAGAGSVSYPVAGGTTGESSFDDDDIYGLTQGYA